MLGVISNNALKLWRKTTIKQPISSEKSKWLTGTKLNYVKISDYEDARYLTAWIEANAQGGTPEKLIDALMYLQERRAHLLRTDTPPNLGRVEGLLSKVHQFRDEDCITAPSLCQAEAKRLLQLALVERMRKDYRSSLFNMGKAKQLVSKNSDIELDYHDLLMKMAFVEETRGDAPKALQVCKADEEVACERDLYSCYISEIGTYEKLNQIAKWKRTTEKCADQFEKMVRHENKPDEQWQKEIAVYLFECGDFRRMRSLLTGEYNHAIGSSEIERAQVKMAVRNLLADAYLKEKDYANAEPYLLKLRNDCAKDAAFKSFMDKAEFKYLYTLAKREKSTDDEFSNYMSMIAKQGKPDGSNQLETLRLFAANPSELGISTETLNSAIEKALRNGDKASPALCAVLRSLLAARLVAQSKFPQALEQLSLAEDNYKRASAVPSSFINLYRDRMVYLQQMKDSAQMERTYKQARSFFEFAPIEAFSTEAKYANLIASTDIQKAIKIEKDLLSSIDKESIYFLESYSDCAADLASNYKAIGAYDDAIKVLKRADEKLAMNRPGKINERKTILLQLSSLYQTKGDANSVALCKHESDALHPFPKFYTF